MATQNKKKNGAGKKSTKEAESPSSLWHSPKRWVGLVAALSILAHFGVEHYRYWNSFSPVVQTQYGPVRGREATTFSGKSYYAYQGLPFAQPPIGDLRFKDPVPPHPWSEVRDARSEGPICYQSVPKMRLKWKGMPAPIELWRGLLTIPSFVTKILTTLGMSEDCLYLNVYVPKPSSADAPKFPSKLPVIVWVHGGAFYIGDGTFQMNGPQYLLEHDVVLVIPSYRLGPLGFLDLGFPDTKANLGLKDIALALRWVQGNIANFGGDPEKVTLSGQSAGGAISHYMSLAPSTKGTFHRLIMQSGSAFMAWAYREPRDARRQSLEYAARLGCGQADAAAALKCLRALDVKHFGDTEKMVPPEGLRFITEFPFTPTVDGELIPASPLELVRSGAYQDVPVIVGVNSHEGYFAFMSIVQRNLTLSDEARAFDASLSSALPNYLRDRLPEGSPELQELGKAIKEFYHNGEDFAKWPEETFIKMYGTILFAYDTHRLIREMSGTAKAPIYAYKFSMDGRLNFFKQILQISELPGASHSDDTRYLFDISMVPHVPLTSSDPEARVRDMMVAMWTNFAKEGNPTPKTTDLLKKTWHPVTTERMFVMNINETLAEQDGLDHTEMAFWDRVFISAFAPQRKASTEKKNKQN